MNQKITEFSKNISGVFILLALLIGAPSIFAQENKNDTMNAQMNKFIQKNSHLLIDFNKETVLEMYNSIENKEISFPEFLRFKMFNATQEAIHHKGHNHSDIPSKILDCNNLGFENAAFAPNWTGGIGTTSAAFNNTTIASNGLNAPHNDPLARHTILSIPPTQNDPSLGPIVGYDPIAIDSASGLAFIPFLPSGGGNYSVRLGNQLAGGQKEKMTHIFDVTASDTLFHYQFAFVGMGITGHPIPSTAPYFKVTMTDTNGQILPAPFGFIYLDSNITLPTPTYIAIGNGVQGLPWQNVNFNLSNYIGQSITVEFEVADCALGGHFGYAYVNAGCGISGNFLIEQCYDASTSTLTGPAGQTNYQWYGPNNSSLSIVGATSPNYTINTPTNGDLYYLTFYDSISSLTLIQDVVVSTDSLSASGNVIADFCAGNSSVLLTGASGNSNYQWYDNNINPISGATNVNHTHQSPIVGDTFYLKFDEDGCPKWQTLVVAEQPHEISQINIAGSCSNGSGGSILATVISPATALTYTLNPGGLIDFNGDFQFLAPGTYQLNIVESSGASCTISMDTTIVVPILTQGSAGSGDTITVCKNEPFNLFQALTGLTDSTGVWTGPFSGQIVNGSMPSNIFNTAGTYSFLYSVADSVCPSDTTSVIIQVLNNCSLGLSEFLNSKNIYVYPNPSLEYFTITFGDDMKPEEYTIYDAAGKEIQSGLISESQSELVINLGKEKQGEYFIRFYERQAFIGSKKIIKL